MQYYGILVFGVCPATKRRGGEDGCWKLVDGVADTQGSYNSIFV